MLSEYLGYRFSGMLTACRKKSPLLAAGVFLGLSWGCTDESTALQSEETVIPHVGVETVQPATLDEVMRTVGTVKSEQQIHLAAQITAQIMSVRVQIGDRVEAGQVLVELDERDVQAQLTQSRAAVLEGQNALREVEQAIRAAQEAKTMAAAQRDLARSTFDRYTALLQEGVVARQHYDEVATRHKIATAEVARAQAAKASLQAKKSQVLAQIAQAKAGVSNSEAVASYTQLRAPVNGLITAKPATVGNLATPGVSLLTLEEERYILETAVAESVIGKVRVGQKVTVSTDALEQDIPASVIEIIPAADPVSRTVTVKVGLPAVPQLRSGLYGTVAFPVGQRVALLVPSAAVLKRGQLHGVFIVEQERIAFLRLILSGEVIGDRVEVLSGLDAGERIIVQGIDQVVDGQAVQYNVTAKLRIAENTT